jgi:dephospho-CoA kinase
MIVIGLTGKMGSGKTLVAKIFECLGAKIYNSDDAAKYLMENDPELKKSLLAHFGENFYLPTHQINKEFVRNLVFENPEKLERLNRIVHPIVYRDFNNFKKINNDISLIIFESAILFKGTNYKNFDYVVLVTAKPKILIQRVKIRSNLPEKTIQNILNNQSIEIPADFLPKVLYINNNGNDLLTLNVYKLYKKLTLGKI